ncbi:MAG TPA: hypothetical protein VFV38_26860, partial [Ktedonobacteraceae bacterium]|nr:hypothetical protein [Ktedonobacteraceae bacterium]
AFVLEEHVYSGSGNHVSDTYDYMLQSASTGDSQQNTVPQNKRLIGARTSSGTQFYITDLLGSVLTAFSHVAGSALILGNQVYTAYGNTGHNVGNMGSSRGFTGQYEDPTG